MLVHQRRYRETVKANLAAEGLIDRHAAAALIGTSVRTLQRWHHAGRGPRRVSRREHLEVLYRRSEVEQWKSSGMQTVANGGQDTAEQHPVQTVANGGQDTAEQHPVQTVANGGQDTADLQPVQTVANGGQRNC
jgi:phage terminase Nu1 subunit (DNA packaging protein)